jgi:N-acetylglucosaminyl-diphospho-decaprenol L-rhamnosyltransferase
VHSIIEQGIATPRDIIVVDNLSGDDSLARFACELPADTRVIASDRNAGFGAGVNTGAKQADAEYLLVLNPDTYFEFDSVAPVLRYMDSHPTAGLVGLDLVNPDRSRQFSARRFYSILDIGARRIELLGRLMSDRVDRHMMRDAWETEEPFTAEWVLGTGFIIRTELFRSIGGMDESYFLYMEDVDLCARVWRGKAEVVCYPGAQLVHDHQRSSAVSPFSFAGKTHIRSLVKFARRFSLPLIRPPGIKRISRQ